MNLRRVVGHKTQQRRRTNNGVKEISKSLNLKISNLFSEWDPNIYIAAHFLRLVAVHKTELQGAQCKIITKRYCITGKHIWVLKEFAGADKIIEEYIGPAGKKGIVEQFIAVSALESSHGRRIQRSFLEAGKHYLVAEKRRQPSNDKLIHYVIGIIKIYT